MEIHIRLAGVELGPYSAEQVRQHMSEGLLSPGDPAKYDGMDEWAPLSEVLARLPPPGPPSSDHPSEKPPRAPAVAPGVRHLSVKQDTGNVSLASLVNRLARKTGPLGPTAPASPSSSGRTGSSTVTTSPLVSAQHGTKKMPSGSLAQTLEQKTTPLPTRVIAAPSGSSVSSAASIPETLPPVQQDPKKAFFPSLARALAAKTVPMRSASASPPVPALSPITAPLPTKPIYRPASGAVPSPAGTKSLREEPEQMVLPDPIVYSVATVDSPEEKRKSGRREKKAASALAEVVSDGPLNEPAPPRRVFRALIGAWALLALLMFYYVWSPYHASSSLRNALSNGDAAALNATVDFPSVRASLKEQIKNQIASLHLMEAKNISSSSPPWPTVLAALDQSIDLYVTPEGISSLVNKPESVAKNDQLEVISPEVAAKILRGFNGQPVGNQGLASVGDFAIDWKAVRFHLFFEGWGWRLKRTELQLPATSDSSSSTLLSPVLDTYLEEGSAEAKKGNWAGAIADFTRVAALDPQSSLAYQDRGLARQSKGDLDGAINDFSQALAINPELATAFNDRGIAKAAKQDLDGAIVDFTQAIHFDPALAAAYDSRGNVKTAKDDLDGAIADFTQSILIDPHQAAAFGDRGFARQANGNLDGAVSDYTQALALNPKTAVAYYNRGLARQSQGKLDAAIDDFDRALASDPKIAGAYYNRGNAKNAKGDLDGAIADFTQAVTLNPKIALAYCNRGLARQTKGDLDGAITDYTQALTLDPKIAVAYYNRSQIKAQKNDFDGAIADTSQALDLDPKNAQAYYLRGFAKLNRGNLDGALADLKQFCDLAPKDPVADHARLYLWLIAKAQNAKTDSDQELSEALENSWNSSPDDLIYKTASFLLSRLSEADYLAAAASPDQKTDQGQHCEAWYFVGMKRLLAADRKGAVDAFHQCVATGQKDYCEYILAQGELQGLEVVPSPARTAIPTAPPRHP